MNRFIPEDERAEAVNSEANLDKILVTAIQNVEFALDRVKDELLTTEQTVDVIDYLGDVIERVARERAKSHDVVSA